MALKKCKECGSQISTKALSCPKCGAVLKKKSGCLGRLVAGLFLILVVMVIVWKMGDNKPGSTLRPPSRAPSRTTTTSESTERQVEVVLPEFKLLDEDVYDAPVKTQVELNILVSGEITQEGLESLLYQEYQKIKARKGFKYHTFPTAVYIYAFTTRQHFESGMGQWIAMLSESHNDTKPAIRIKKDLIAKLGAKPEVRFGLSKEQREQIWRELVKAEDKATKEADAKYPINPAQSLQVGTVIQLTEQTPLMPELDPVDPMGSLSQIRRLPAGSYIRVLSIATKGNTPWYNVRALSSSKVPLGTGWINSIALIGQFDVKGMLKRNSELQSSLNDKYEAEIGKKYNLTGDQLLKIYIEAIEQNWPFPP